MRTFESFGIPFDRDVYARTYSPNWYHTFRSVGLAEEQWAEADARWLGHFADEHVALIDGARDSLSLLTERGVTAAIVTSGSRDRVTREILDYGLHFAECVFGSDVHNRKPHPEALQLCLSRLGIPPRDAAYVGDSPEDVEMARAAGVVAVAVPGGYPNREALAAARPDLFAPTIREAVRSLVA